jgi:hypothetical protein
LGGSLACQSAGAGDHGFKFAQGGFQAVHFPVSGDQRQNGVGHVNYPANVSVMDALAEARRQFQIPVGDPPGC